MGFELGDTDSLIRIAIALEAVVKRLDRTLFYLEHPLQVPQHNGGAGGPTEFQVNTSGVGHAPGVGPWSVVLPKVIPPSITGEPK
jgi:hypothetical protein